VLILYDPPPFTVGIKKKYLLVDVETREGEAGEKSTNW